MRLADLGKALAGLFGTGAEEVVLAEGAADELCHFAREVAPKEFMAVLKGGVRGKELRITELVFQPFVNTVASSSMSMDLPLMSGSVGTAHSHPSGSNRPSRQDLRLFAKMGGVHLIIGSPYRRENIACYLSDGTRVEFSVG
ncbi:Mov34/MPN/PAD-1 family protein [Candidatus Woesearchaeota archaeon]|nr:Mov34/MPN/PAD-1 family protein [Candidatus Woesearchaeota archaeon]